MKDPFKALLQLCFKIISILSFGKRCFVSNPANFKNQETLKILKIAKANNVMSIEWQHNLFAAHLECLRYNYWKSQNKARGRI